MDRFEGSYIDLKSAMPTTEIPQELRAIIMFDGAGVEGLEETVLLGKVNMNQKDSLLVQIELAMKDVLGPGPCEAGAEKQSETVWYESRLCREVKMSRAYGLGRKSTKQ